MANRHFGNIGDVWKHAALVEVLEREPPGWYAETHAGSGAYAVVNDGGRRFGILRFLEVAPRFPALARSRYRAVAASYVGSDRGLYPGSALLAMSVLGDACSFLLCDLDPESVTDLRRWSRELGAVPRWNSPPASPTAARLSCTGMATTSPVRKARPTSSWPP
jgi:23S rRNA A2030 N6-methylase RlmJ